jgi:hypothetical protein
MNPVCFVSPKKYKNILSYPLSASGSVSRHYRNPRSLVDTTKTQGSVSRHHRNPRSLVDTTKTQGSVSRHYRNPRSHHSNSHLSSKSPPLSHHRLCQWTPQKPMCTPVRLTRPKPTPFHREPSAFSPSPPSVDTTETHVHT